MKIKQILQENAYKETLFSDEAIKRLEKRVYAKQNKISSSSSIDEGEVISDVMFGGGGVIKI